MSDTNLKPKFYGHVSAGSIDTNASANAESTISMGLSRFPEPPSSIPSTPLRSEFGSTPSPSRTTFLIPPIPLNSPLRSSVRDAGRFSLPASHPASRDRSFKRASAAFHAPYVKDNKSRSSQLPSAYDSDGTSTIDGDATEDRPLPTSFINSLLQENKVQPKLKHTTTSDAMSGISEMTFPPLDQLDSNDTLYASQSSGRPLDSHIPPPSAYSQAHKSSARISGDSETLHSNQDHTSIFRTISRGVRVQDASVVGIARATLRNVSGVKRCSSSLDTESTHCTDKPLHHPLPTTYEADGYLSDGYKAFNSYSPSLPSTIGKGDKSETTPMAAASGLSPSHTVLSPAKHQPAATSTSVLRKKKRIYFLIFAVLIIALAAIGAGIGIPIGSRKKQHLSACTGPFTGAACNLDATCVCTSSTGCNGLAKAVADLVPMVNQNFVTNISSISAYNSLWIMQGSPTTSNCASQALLIDVGNGNAQHLYPNGTQWAQTALLWNAIQTQDMEAAGRLQQFVQKIPWTSLGTTDGPISTANSDPDFLTTIAGFTFNFASQTVSQPSASFVTLGQPTNAQISRVSSQAQTTLDRMYAFAQASSTQRQTALKTYWTSVLLQRPQDLAVFKAVLSVSPVLLPFNASSPPIRTLYSNSSSSLFPPPLACFPDLTSEVRQQINSVETGVFGLQPIADTTLKFDTSCYQDRPVYGVLDVLRLRLPFFDSQTGTVKQAVVLNRDANPRVVLYNGLTFGTPLNGTSTVTSSQLDARQYGTLSLFDHVVLQYLTSMPDVNTASALVSFVLGAATNAAIPPDRSSPLFQSLHSIPFLEVAVFGNVGPPDLTSTVASFTTASNSLFFGSADGTALRDWTINTVGGPVVWTENATSPLVIRDNSLGNTTISQTWDAISMAISNNIPGIGLSNITTTLQGTQNFSP